MLDIDYSATAIKEIIDEHLPDGFRVEDTGPIKDLIERYINECNTDCPLLVWNPDA